jgi:hypothetical protein
MKNTLSAVVLLLFFTIIFSSCAQKIAKADDQIDESAIIDQGMKHITDIKAQIGNRTLKTHAFAVIGSKIMSVFDPNNFPPDTEESIIIYTDHKNRILRSIEMPTSKSGDWFIVYEKYFDLEGNITAFYRHSSSFNRGCTEMLREDTYRFYDSNHNMLAEKKTFSDKDGKEISPVKCNLLYQFEYVVDETVGDFLQRKLFSIE